MVRVVLIVTLSTLFPAWAFAFSKIGKTPIATLVIAVGDEGAFVWKPTEQECRDWPHWVPPGSCAKYQRLTATPAPNGQAVPSGSQVKSAETSKPKPRAPQARIKPRFDPSWPKPLTPPQKAAALKLMPLQPGLENERISEMVGQLLISGFEGTSPADSGVIAASAALRRGKIAGVLVRGINIESYQQLKALLSYIGRQDAAGLIAIEQPGGPDATLSEDRGFAAYAAPGAVGSAMPPDEAQLLYRDMAAELSSAGVNLNIGPSGEVCRESGIDLSADCFGVSASSVNAFGRALTFGHHDRRVLTALRHTLRKTALAREPAPVAILHGVANSQISDAIVVRIKASELLSRSAPFAGAAWLRDQIQNCGPASVLLVELDVEDEGVPVRYREAIIRAFQAGADMVMVREPSRLQEEFYDLSLEAIRMGIETGALSQTAIETAYQRVRRMKEEFRTKISAANP